MNWAMGRIVAGLVLALVLLGGCQAPWTADQRTDALAAVDAAEQRGDIDDVAAAAAREAIAQAAEGFGSSDLLQMLLEIGAAAGLAYLGVNVRRGAPKPLAPQEAAVLRQVVQERLAGVAAQAPG